MDLLNPCHCECLGGALQPQVPSHVAGQPAPQLLMSGLVRGERHPAEIHGTKEAWGRAVDRAGPHRLTRLVSQHLPQDSEFSTGKPYTVFKRTDIELRKPIIFHHNSAVSTSSTSSKS